MRAIIWTGTILFTVGIIIGFTSDSTMFEGISYMAESIWGILTMADLTLGLVLFSCIIYLNEESKSKAALWILALFLTGNPATGLYLILNFDKIRAKLSGERFSEVTKSLV